MRILVLVADYPNIDGGIALMYVHTRNKYYVENGIEVTVLNFKTAYDYIYEGIQVISLNTYKYSTEYNFDILVLHAANILKHYTFIKEYQNRFKKLVFFFHGHEVLQINKVYPKPYPYIKNNYLIKLLQNVYDIFKLAVWRSYFIRNSEIVHFVFVSNWMYNQFMEWTQIPPNVLSGKYNIIYNCVNKIFEMERYEFESEKVYDFITIRGDLDGSKYSVDIVNALANANPQYHFLVVGKGKFFSYFQKAENITWLNAYLNHTQIIEHLNKSRCALMPTRTDAQGLMMCEMATFGIPVVTSNLPVCYEVLDGFDNVAFIDNTETDKNLSEVLRKLTNNLPYEKNDIYFNKNTSAKEVELLKGLL